tara:strand:+ start:647 stop:1177 length:531 start_codon:yes stop_codon:yes gene_type:complete
MKRELICGAAIGVITVGLTAFNAFAESYTVQGVVTGVEPVYKTRTVTDPVQRCWTEEVPVYGQGKNNDSSVFGMDLEGAIIGGILGNNVVKGDNAGAAGAIIGGLIGSDMKNKNNQVITGYRQVNKCNTQYNERREEYLAGYNISYEALGLRGTITRTRSTNVGDNISVNVNITAY